MRISWFDVSVFTDYPGLSFVVFASRERLRATDRHAEVSDMSESPARLLYCRCAYAQVVPQEVKDGVLRHLCGNVQPFESVADLCEMSARRDPRLATLAGDTHKIIACHPRAVKWLFHAAGAPIPEETEIINLRTLTTEEACAQLAK